MTELVDVLRRAQGLGFLGPGPVEDHLLRAEAFAAAVDVPRRALDLGSGGGVPGLALAQRWPSAHWVLLDSNQRRTAFLTQVTDELGLRDRVEIWCDRAEQAGRSELRGMFDLVVARSFGAPAVTAECGSPFLTPGGRLLVSEPPGDEPGRWPDDGLATLDLEDQGRIGGVRVLRQRALTPSRYPRRVGVPGKRPLW